MVGNTSVFCIATVRLVPVQTSLWIFLVADEVDVVARGAAHRVERLDQRHAGGEHGGQRARPARDRRLADQRRRRPACLQDQPVHEDLHRQRALPGVEEAVDAAADRRRRSMYQYCDEESDIAITNSVGAGRSAPKLVNTCLNAGITKIMMTAVMTKATTMIDDRIEQRRLDLALDREDLFLVGRQAVEQGVENTGLPRPRPPGCRTARRNTAGTCGTPARATSRSRLRS